MNKMTLSNLGGDGNGDGEKQQNPQESKQTPSRSANCKTKICVEFYWEKLLHDVQTKRVKTRMGKQKLLEDDEDRLFRFCFAKEVLKSSGTLKNSRKICLTQCF
jgi:hypothetical protein